MGGGTARQQLLLGYHLQLEVEVAVVTRRCTGTMQR